MRMCVCAIASFFRICILLHAICFISTEKHVRMEITLCECKGQDHNKANAVMQTKVGLWDAVMQIPLCPWDAVMQTDIDP